MTSEEMKQTIEFMLEHQAKFDTKQEIIQEDIKALTSVVSSLALQIEADHQITTNSINALNNAVHSINNNIVEMRDQANKDRQEMRVAVNSINNAIGDLAKIVGGIHTRVSHLEDKAS